MSTTFLLFDCETTGLPLRRNLSPSEVSGWPRLVQLAWEFYDSSGNPEDMHCQIIRPDGFEIPPEATGIHGISHSLAVRDGVDLIQVLDEFGEAIERPEITLVAHNIDFDRGVVGAEFIRSNKKFNLFEIPGLCTMKTTTDLCRLPRWSGPGFKWPTLEELHRHLFSRSYKRPHHALNDLRACARCFFRLVEEGYYHFP